VNTRQTITAEHDDRRPLTLADLADLLDRARTAGIPDNAELTNVRSTIGGKLKRVDVTG